MEALFVVGLSLLIFLLVRRSGDQSKRPSVKVLLQDIDRKIAYEPDNAQLYLIQAELLSQTAAHWSSLTSLEHAFEKGISKQEIEPSYWAIYDNITSPYRTGYFGDADSAGGSSGSGVNQHFWRRWQEEAPSLSKVMASGLSESEARLAQRKTEPFVSSDKARRAELLEQSAKLLGMSNENSR